MTDEEAVKVLQAAHDVANSYRSAGEQEEAIAASNTGWLILKAFGYSTGQINKFAQMLV